MTPDEMIRELNKAQAMAKAMEDQLYERAKEYIPEFERIAVNGIQSEQDKAVATNACKFVLAAIKMRNADNIKDSLETQFGTKKDE